MSSGSGARPHAHLLCLTAHVRLRQDPRVSLTVMDANDWYRHVSIIGRAAELADDSNLSGIDRLSTHYLGNPYGQRDRPRVNAWIEIGRWRT